MKNSTHFTQFVELLKPFKLIEVESLQGFHLDGIFSSHLAFMRYANFLTRISEESGECNIPNFVSMKVTKEFCPILVILIKKGKYYWRNVASIILLENRGKLLFY